MKKIIIILLVVALAFGGAAVGVGLNEKLNPEPVPHVLMLGDEGLKNLNFVLSNSGTIAGIGFKITDLKPNTKYNVSWILNQEFLTETSARFSQHEIDGEIKKVIRYFSDVKSSDSSAFNYYSVDNDITYICTSNHGEGTYIRTGDDGFIDFLQLFEADYVSDEQLSALVIELESYVLNVVFTEVIE